MLDHLTIRSQHGTLALQKTDAKLDTRFSFPRLQIRGTETDTVQIKSNPPDFDIDQSDSFDTLHIGPTLRWMDSYYKTLEAKGIETIARIVSDGVRYMHIEKNGDPAKELARQKTEKLNNHELTIEAIRHTNITYKAGEVEINVPTEAMKIDIQFDEDPGDFTRGDVAVNWRTRPSIDITVTPGQKLSIPAAPSAGGRLDTTL